MKASALTTVMFIMQACYGSPYGSAEMPQIPEEEMAVQNDSVQLQVEEEVAAGSEVEAE